MINNKLEELFNEFVEEKQISFPSETQINQWEDVLDAWCNDRSMKLFVRQTSKPKGAPIINNLGRIIIRTDNTPAHWVYRKFVLNNEIPSLIDIKKELDERTFKIAIIIKQTEKEYILKSEVAKKELTLGNDNWKIAHIVQIKLPGNKTLPLSEYINHHKRFLSLKNIYLIKKEFSGLAEVKRFNDIVIRYRANSLNSL
jgi:hypothetical protein